MASPTLFAVVSDALPRERRALGFTVQSILRRVPIAVAPILGGLAIAAYGLRSGVHLGLTVTFVLSIVTRGVVSRVNVPVTIDPIPTHIHSGVAIAADAASLAPHLGHLHPHLRGSRRRLPGLDLVAVQMTTAIVSYIPVARFADRMGRKPFVIATFVAFALFPIAVVQARDFATLVAAFVVGGLREVGEPARKAPIVDLVAPSLRARSIGLYYLIRSLSIAPAAFIGGLLWEVTPGLRFWMAGVIGFIGVVVFAVTLEERYAG